MNVPAVVYICLSAFLFYHNEAPAHCRFK